MGINVTEKENKTPIKQKNKVQKPPNNITQKPIVLPVFSLLNLVFIVLLAGGGFYSLQGLKDKQLTQGDEIGKDDMREIEVSKQLNAYQTQLAAMQSQITIFSDSINSKDTHFNKTLADFSQLHTEKLEMSQQKLSTELGQIKRQLGKTRGDWLVADAEYLLSIANQRLDLTGDIKTTIMALEAADQRLRESGDSAVFKVRKQIIKEISELKLVNLPDIIGIYAKLQLLKDGVKKLTVVLPYAGKPLAESKYDSVHSLDEPDKTDVGLLDSLLNQLENYVKVRRAKQPIAKILTEEEAGFIRQQLNIKLEMIKIALVQKNDTLYGSSIDGVKQWMNDNFTQNMRAKHFLTELNQLKTIQLSNQTPNISQSLKMLKDLTKLRFEFDKTQTKSVKKPTADQVIVTPVAN